MQSDYFEKLQIERQKLDMLVDEALQNGTPISETYGIMAQYRKVKRLATISEALKQDEIIEQSRKLDGIALEAEREREE